MILSANDHGYLGNFVFIWRKSLRLLKTKIARKRTHFVFREKANFRSIFRYLWMLQFHWTTYVSFLISWSSYMQYFTVLSWVSWSLANSSKCMQRKLFGSSPIYKSYRRLGHQFIRGKLQEFDVSALFTNFQAIFLIC